MSRICSVVAASSGARERRTERQTTRARRARRARTPRVALAAAVEQGRSRALFVFYSSSSLRVCRSARAAPSLHPRRRVARSPRAFVPSVVPRAPLSCSEPLRRRVGRAPREGARTHTERDARGRPAWGVRAPRALGESAAAFARRSPLGVWRRFALVPSVAPRAPLCHSEASRRRVGRSPRAGTSGIPPARERRRAVRRPRSRGAGGGGARVPPPPPSPPLYCSQFGLIEFEWRSRHLNSIQGGGKKPGESNVQMVKTAAAYGSLFCSS